MTLYKYVNSDRIDVLQNKLIRYTPLALLNDPYEATLNFGQQITFADILDHCGDDPLGYARAEILKDERARKVKGVEAKLGSGLID
jgi:hypothetical protein